MKKVLVLVTLFLLNVNTFAACGEKEFEVQDIKEGKDDAETPTPLCVPYVINTYTDAEKDIPKKEVEKDVAAFLKARNEKAPEACKKELDGTVAGTRRKAYDDAKKAFDEEFKAVKGRPEEKKKLSADQKAKLDGLEAKMLKERARYLPWEYACGNCYVKIAKRWKGEIGTTPLYYQTEGTCLAPKAKNTWVENGIKFFGRIGNYGKGSDMGLTSIDVYRKFDVKMDGEKITIAGTDFKPGEASDKQLSFDYKKDAETFGEHYAYISVQAPTTFATMSLGYPYRGWAEYKKTDKLEVGRVVFNTFFKNNLRLKLEEKRPTPTRCAASGKCEVVGFKRVNNAFGNWDFTYDTNDGTITYFTAGDFGSVFAFLGEGAEKVFLFPHAVRTVMETVWEALERLAKEEI